jgi:hypothetical protein
MVAHIMKLVKLVVIWVEGFAKLVDQTYTKMVDHSHEFILSQGT